MTKTRSSTLLEKAASLSRKRVATWIDKLDAATRNELLALRDAWQAGELPNATARGLAFMIHDTLKNMPGEFTLRTWLNDKA